MNKNWVGALAFEQRENELRQEWPQIQTELGRLFLGPAPQHPLIWAQDYWDSVQLVEFQSIGDAVKILKKNSLRWVNLESTEHRRAKLIQEQLKTWTPGKIEFLKPPSAKTFGVWTLQDKNHLLFCSKPKSLLPLGEILFQENKAFPPTRAYLKLWEVFTFHQPPPSRGTSVLDLGSCPGGWTWVLQGLGLKVFSVDKAPLDPQIQNLPHVQFIKADAFDLKLEQVGPTDWLFSDLICTPEKLFSLVKKWQAYGLKNFICTLKFKGSTDFEIIKKFQAIPGSKIVHLYHNKHELTWILTESPVA